MTPAAAVELVPDGSTVALGGFAITRCVVAMAHALIRAGRRDMTIVQVVGGMETDLLVGSGCVSRLLYSGGSLDRFGNLFAVNAAVASGQIVIEEYSSLSLTLRLHAGSLGLPYVPTRSMLGSDLAKTLIEQGRVLRTEDPFSGSSVLLLPALRPDVAIVHADAVDRYGNAVLDGARWTIREVALASACVIVLCEEMVDTVEPGRVVIPGAAVSAIVPVEHGAHPTAVYRRYEYDRPHLEEYVSLARQGTKGFHAYLERYVTSVESHEEYLDLASRHG